MSSSAEHLALINQAHVGSARIEQIRATLSKLIDAEEISVSEIKRFTTYSAPSISQWLNGKYEADAGKLDEAMRRFYRRWLSDNAIVPTRATQEIHAVMVMAHKRLEISCLIGGFGRGKTKSANNFVLKNDFAILIEITALMSPIELLKQIGGALGISDAVMRGGGSEKLNAIIRALARREVKPLLIFDEADKLRPRTLSVLQDVYGPESAGRCAMLLIGTPALDQLLRSPELGYFRRRVTIAREIGEIEFDEAVKLVNMWPHDLAKSDIKELHDYALKRYGVATIVNLLKRAYDVMQIQKETEISSEHLQSAYAYLLR